MISPTNTPTGTAQREAIAGLVAHRAELQQSITEGGPLPQAGLAALIRAYSTRLNHSDVAETLEVPTSSLVTRLGQAAQTVVGLENAQPGDLLLARGEKATTEVVRTAYDPSAPESDRHIGLCDPDPDYDYNLWERSDLRTDPRQMRVLLIRPA